MVAFGTALYIVDAALLSVLLPDHAKESVLERVREIEGGEREKVRERKRKRERER